MLGQHSTILRQIDIAFNLGTIGGLTDAQLVEGFLSWRGPPAEAAFAALVRRHGPMVLRVCRSVLRDHHDAQDASQATFLVLAQGQLRPGGRLAGPLAARGGLPGREDRPGRRVTASGSRVPSRRDDADPRHRRIPR